MEVAVLINVKDRPSELALLLQSLRTQTYKSFDVFILDDCSGTPLTNYHFFNCIANRLKQEGHNVYIQRTDFCEGVAKARQKIVDWVKSMPFDYEYYLRVDDDVVLEPNYIEELFEVIYEGYDLASGVTVPMQNPTPVRDPIFLKGVANRVILDENGNYIMNGDDCGMEYSEKVILPLHHFRSCCLYKSEIHDKANYCPTPLSWHGFREEQIFSYRILMAGYNMGFNSHAVNYHQMTPSGGERGTQTNENTLFNQEQLEKFTREHKSILKPIFDRDKIELDEKELTKNTNLLMKRTKLPEKFK